jgi:Flp pilus assembly protein TadG
MFLHPGTTWRTAEPTVRRFGRDCDGVAAIELAVGMVPLVALMLGGITYGGVLAAMIDINQAAGEGARAAIAGVTLCERQTIAEAKARDALLFAPFASAAGITATVTADAIRVEIALPYGANALTPVLFPVPDTLTAAMVANTDGPEFPASGC